MDGAVQLATRQGKVCRNRLSRMGFERATSAKDAKWVEEALRKGDWTNVASVVPSNFEAHAAILYPAWHCVCTEENEGNYAGGSELGRPIRWSEVAKASVPVIQNYAPNVRGMRRTQYRRLDDGSWITDDLSKYGDEKPLIRPGDEWIVGAGEGSLVRDMASSLIGLLEGATATPESCWFGIWEGYGGFSDDLRDGPAISIPERRWLLFRAPLGDLTTSIETLYESRRGQTSVVYYAPAKQPGPEYDPDDSTFQFANSPGGTDASEWPPPDIEQNKVHYQSANMVWPEDRSWCLATEIDLPCTFISGSRELISSVLNEPHLEARIVLPGDRFPELRDVLQPVVDKPPDLSLPPAFESRKPPPGWEAAYEAERELGLRVMAEFIEREIGIKVAGEEFAGRINKRKGKN